MNDDNDAQKLEGLRSYAEEFIVPWFVVLGAIWLLSRLVSCCASL